MKEEIFEDLFKNVVVCGRYPYEKLEEMRCYLNSLVDANEILKSQLKAKEDLLKEICEEVAEYVATDGEIFQTSKENIYEILSKGENK